MIHHHAQPGGGDMTDIAFIGGHQMSGGLAAGDNAIMTTAADPDYLRMIHRRRRHRQPGDEIQMAGLAHIRAGNMDRGFSRRPNAGGVAQHAVIHNTDFFVGERRRQPGGNAMTNIAGGRGRNMIRRLPRRGRRGDH